MAVLGTTTLTGCNSIPDFIPSGTLVLFETSTAPPSWTRSVSTLGATGSGTLRVVSGSIVSGGTLDFPAAFGNKPVAGSVGAYTLSEPELPSHAHGNSAFAITHAFNPLLSITGRLYSGSAGGGGGSGGSHDHPLSASADFSVLYVDLILASKN